MTQQIAHYREGFVAMEQTRPESLWRHQDLEDQNLSGQMNCMRGEGASKQISWELALFDVHMDSSRGSWQWTSKRLGSVLRLWSHHENCRSQTLYFYQCLHSSTPIPQRDICTLVLWVSEVRDWETAVSIFNSFCPCPSSSSHLSSLSACFFLFDLHLKYTWLGRANSLDLARQIM